MPSWLSSCIEVVSSLKLNTVLVVGGALAIQPQYELAIGEDLKAQAQASDKKVNDLPSFPDIGKSLNKQFGQSDPKEVGDAINKNTPGIICQNKPKCNLANRMQGNRLAMTKLS